jgi:pilus assembly protein Flp/PilA
MGRRANKEIPLQLINSFITNLTVRLTSLRQEAHEEGQTLVEYGLILALMSVVLAGVLVTLEGSVTGLFNDVVAAFS